MNEKWLLQKIPVPELPEVIGFDSKEQLLVVPGKFVKLIIKRPKYARKNNAKTEILQVKVEPEIIRGYNFQSLVCRI